MSQRAQGPAVVLVAMMSLAMNACGSGGGGEGGATGGTVGGSTSGTAGGSTGTTTGGGDTGSTTGDTAGGTTGGTTGDTAGGTTGGTAGSSTGDSTGGSSTGGSTGGGTTGGSSTGGTTGSTDPGVDESRLIDLSAAKGNFDLSTPETAAKSGVAVLAAGLSAVTNAPGAKSAAGRSTGSAPSGAPKQTVRCRNGGTEQTTTTSTAGGFMTTIIANQCSQDDLLTDGRIYLHATRFDFSGAAAGTFEFGDGAVTYLSEILAPADARSRSLLLGAGTFDVDSTQSGDYAYRLQGAFINLTNAEQPRVDFELGNASTPFAMDIVFGNAGTVLDMRGPYRVASPCASGAGSLDTTTALQIDNEDRAIVAGQIMLSSGTGSATYTYNGRNASGEPEVTIDTAGGSATYTQSELEALCNL